MLRLMVTLVMNLVVVLAPDRAVCLVHFSLYFIKLIHLTEENNCQGVYVNDFHPNATMLMYADDLVIVGDHIGRVQKLLNTLSEFCNKWGLKVNMSKTKSLIFRNGGIIEQNEVLHFKDKKLENVSYYKYLNLTMSTHLSWSPAQVTLATQNIINQANYKCDYSFKSGCNILTNVLYQSLHMVASFGALL